MSGRLEFIFGAMGAGKSAYLIDWKNASQQPVGLFKPATDTRTKNTIRSRNGREEECTVVNDYKHLDLLLLKCVFRGEKMVGIDEAQFLSKESINVLRKYANAGLHIRCTGLLLDFRGILFETSRLLLEMADYTNVIDAYCEYCGSLARYNIRLDADGKRVMDGRLIEIGSDNYKTICGGCFFGGEDGR